MQNQAITVRSTGQPPGFGAAASLSARRPLTDAFALTGAPLTVAKDAEIFGQGEPAEYAYGVVSGVVRTHKTLSDGHRQINAFLLPGEIFGLDAGDEHRFTAEAVCDSTVVFIKRSELAKLAEHDCDVANGLWALAADELRRLQDRTLLLGHGSAQERVASFLLEMAGRTTQSDTVVLPMSRQDIADYLSLTIETVSRTLTALGHAEVIRLPESRTVQLCNKAALARLNS